MFVNHAKKMVAKGCLVAIEPYMFTKTTGGIAAEVIKKVVNSYIFSILIYAAPVWWLGKMWMNKTEHTI